MKRAILVDTVQVDDIYDQILLARKLASMLEIMNLHKERIVIQIWDEEREEVKV